MEPGLTLMSNLELIVHSTPVPYTHCMQIENKQCHTIVSVPFNHFSSPAHISGKSKSPPFKLYVLSFVLDNKLLQEIITYDVFS